MDGRMRGVLQGISDIERDLVPFAQPHQRAGHGAVDAGRDSLTSVDDDRRIADGQIVAALRRRQAHQPPLVAPPTGVEGRRGAGRRGTSRFPSPAEIDGEIFLSKEPWFFSRFVGCADRQLVDQVTALQKSKEPIMLRQIFGTNH